MFRSYTTGNALGWPNNLRTQVLGTTDSHFNELAARKPCDTWLYEDEEAPEERNSVPTSRITPEHVARTLKEMWKYPPPWRLPHQIQTLESGRSSMYGPGHQYNICVKYERVPDT
jgi:hypothetical protein